MISKEIADKITFIEKNFKIIDKEANLVPMILKKAQRHFIENKTHKNVCVKGRQMGFSTGVGADCSHDLFTLPYQKQTIITHDSETSEFLFQNVQRFYRNLPWNIGVTDDLMQPKHDWKSGTRMRFPVIDSYIYIDSSKSDSIGIGHTINHVHLSEVSKWSDKRARQLWADITQTVPMNAYITVESTPTGRNGLFYDIYQEALKGINGFTPFFYPWWWDDGYFADTSIWMTNEKAEITASILGISLPKFLKEEQSFAEYNKLSPGQMAFRRMKIGEIKLLFFQEYPENDKDCWLSNEMSVVNGASLRPYYSQVKEGRVEGDLTIWKDVNGGRNYVIGVDVASGQARDYSVASVMDVRTMEYVARLRGKIRTDLFSEQLYNLGKRYNNACVAVERTGHGHVVLKILLDKNYPNLYYFSDYDDRVNANVTDAGWKTSLKTKPMMINGMIAAFDSGDLISWSENLLMETSSIVWEGGADSKVKTVSGGNDDEWIAVSIALQVREVTPIIGDNNESEIGHSSYVSKSLRSII
jgi:hypothetical protein